MPTLHNTGINLSTDRRKRLSFRFFYRHLAFNEPGRTTDAFNFSPFFRVNDRLNFRWGLELNQQKNNVGYVNKVDKKSTQDEDIIFGRRDVSTVVNNFNAEYNFNSNMALTFRMRHYWSQVSYNSFHLLEEDGRLGSTDYNQMHDTNFNAFNIDMIYRWRFAPGSDIFIIWKNSILNFEERADLNYFGNVDGLFDNPQRNSLSMKLIYFLDYVNLKKNRPIG